MVLNSYIFTKKNLHLSILFRIERRRIYCPTRYHSHFVIFTHSPDTEPSDSYILPFVTAGIPSASTLFLLYRRFWTAAPRWVPDIPSAVSHHPAALWNQVCMYYSSSTHFSISLLIMIANRIINVKMDHSLFLLFSDTDSVLSYIKVFSPRSVQTISPAAAAAVPATYM